MPEQKVQKIEDQINSLELKFGKFEATVVEKLSQIVSSIADISAALKEKEGDQKELIDKINEISVTIHDNRQEIEDLKDWRIRCEEVLESLSSWKIQWGAVLGFAGAVLGAVSVILGIYLSIKNL